MVKKGLHMVELYKENGVPASRLILRLPATWAGIQAAKQLEQKGVATQVFLVYSFIQGVAAAQAGVSVIQPNVGRTNDWHNRHPGAIRDPFGPREDAGVSSTANPGLRLASELYIYCQKFHPKTKVMASGVRTKDDALALSGIDYIILPLRVMSELSALPTTAGYNDGLSATSGDAGLDPELSPAMAKAHHMSEVVPVYEDAFNERLGLVGAQLLDAGLALKVQDAERLNPYFSKTTSATSST